MRKLLLVFISLLLLTSCMTLNDMRSDVDEYQLICGVLPYMTEETTLTAWTRTDNGKIEITMFLPTGQTFCTMAWDGKNLEYDSSFVENGQMFAKAIIKDFTTLYKANETGPFHTIKGKGYSYTVEVL